MKKRHVKKVHHRPSRGKAPSEQYLVIVRSWMLVVVFALMLGVGAIVGTFLNAKLNETTPAVAGVQTEAR